MKKIIALFLLITTLFSLSACSCFQGNDKNPPERIKIRIGYMAGPTGMGMAKLISDNGGLENGNEKYSFTKYADTKAAQADLTAGKIDVICLPTNEAAVYFNTVEENPVMVLAINCLNSLYLIANRNESISSLSDFEGKTIYTCKNGTPRIVLEYILKESGINATVSYEINGKEIATPADLSAQAIAGNIPNALIPEPLITSTLMKINSTSSSTELMWSVKINISNEWEKICDTPVAMGCIIADSDFVSNNKASIDMFLEEYKESIDYIANPSNLDSAANYVVETGVIGAAPAAKMALTNLGDAISYIDGKDMKHALIGFYNAIGVKLPDESFYYEK